MKWMDFDERGAATAIAAIGWRLEMLDPTALRGAATRAFQDQIVRMNASSALVGLGDLPNLSNENQ